MYQTRSQTRWLWPDRRRTGTKVRDRLKPERTQDLILVLVLIQNKTSNQLLKAMVGLEPPLVVQLGPQTVLNGPKLQSSLCEIQNLHLGLSVDTSLGLN